MGGRWEEEGRRGEEGGEEGGGEEKKRREEGRPRQDCALESARKKKVGLRQIPHGETTDKRLVL